MPQHTTRVTLTGGHCGGCVSGGQIKQCVCTVGVGCSCCGPAAAANCCCGPTCGVCTGVPGPGPGQFGLATMVQMFGCVCCKQLIGSVTQVSEQMFRAVGQLTMVQAMPMLGHGGAQVGCGHPGSAVWIWQPGA